MRADGACSDAFQTKTTACGVKIKHDRVSEEVPRRSQTTAIGFDGRKGQNGKSESIAAAFEEAKSNWLKKDNNSALRADLLKILLELEGE